MNLLFLGSTFRDHVRFRRCRLVEPPSCKYQRNWVDQKKHGSSGSSWWFQPIWKNISQASKWESSPNRGEHKKCLKPPPRGPLHVTLEISYHHLVTYTLVTQSHGGWVQMMIFSFSNRWIFLRFLVTPWKINGWFTYSTNHPSIYIYIEKGTWSEPSTSVIMCNMLIFRGVIFRGVHYWSKLLLYQYECFAPHTPWVAEGLNCQWQSVQAPVIRKGLPSQVFEAKNVEHQWKRKHFFFV